MTRVVSQQRQLTLRNLDPRLEREIRALAKRERISLNKAASRLLQRGAGIAPVKDTDRIGSSLDHLIGTWKQREADAFLESIAACEQIDAELWE